jgi:para-aminobenzoate synthetase component 1
MSAIQLDRVVELHEVQDALPRLEATLRSAGFFEDGGAGAAGLCADVYLGYGLSAALRRTRRPGPPEPVRLPLAAVRVRPDRGPGVASWACRVGEWEPTWTADAYARAIEAARQAIAAGEVYQVNLVQHLSAPFAGTADGVAARLSRFRPLVPRPLVGDGWAVISASPELYLERRGSLVRTRPIKGTRPLDGLRELGASAKDAAEHVMIVDLERNDLGRVCRTGSVRWPELMAAGPMAGVAHLVSTVEGELRPEIGFAQLVEALFPGGSVTGAPKVAAIDHIAALEPVGRGASMGALGVVRPNGDFVLALTIRTFAVADGRIHLWVGGGIVHDSDPRAEVEESWVKARPLLEALGAPVPSPVVT